MEQETRQRKPYNRVQCKLIDFGRGQAMFAAGSGDSTTGTFYSPIWFSTRAGFIADAPAWLEYYNSHGNGYGAPVTYPYPGTPANPRPFDWSVAHSNLSMLGADNMANLLNTLGPAETFRQMYDCDQNGPFHHSPGRYWWNGGIDKDSPYCSWWESYYGGDCTKGHYCC